MSGHAYAPALGGLCECGQPPAAHAVREPYGGRPPFVAGSDTSEAAADSVVETVGKQRRAVLDAIAVSGLHGMTCDAVEAALGLRHQACSARVRELVLTGRIYDTGERRETRSGRRARVYRARAWTPS